MADYRHHCRRCHRQVNFGGTHAAHCPDAVQAQREAYMNVRVISRKKITLPLVGMRVGLEGRDSQQQKIFTEIHVGWFHQVDPDQWSTLDELSFEQTGIWEAIVLYRAGETKPFHRLPLDAPVRIKAPVSITVSLNLSRWAIDEGGYGADYVIEEDAW